VIVWIFLLGGLAVAAFGTTVAVGAAAVGRVQLMRWISRHLRGAAVASTLLARPGRLLRVATAVGTIGVLTAGMGLAAFMPSTTVPVTAALILVGAVPVVSLLAYGIPRAIGQRWCEAVVRRAGPWMERLSWLLRPVLPGSSSARATDLAEVLRAGSAEDLLEPGEVTVIAGVLDFTRRPVRDVMTPRPEVVALPVGASLEEVGRTFAESGYSRLPVYSDSLDNITGMIYAFDVLKVAPAGELPIRPVTVTPGSKPCAEVLLELQRERRHLAVVLDEFGGTDGIASIEDLLELLVGDIFEESEQLEVLDTPEPVLEFDGAAPSSEVTSRFGVALPGDSETIGGFLARAAGRIPHPGDRFTLNGLEFDVLAASPTRIERIAVRRGPVKAVSLEGSSPE
jgi:CBS domain containing-hemolysin-like protein